MSKPRGDPSCGTSSGDALIRTERHPACRRREPRPGFRAERENLHCVHTGDFLPRWHHRYNLALVSWRYQINTTDRLLGIHDYCGLPPEAASTFKRTACAHSSSILKYRATAFVPMSKGCASPEWRSFSILSLVAAPLNWD